MFYLPERIIKHYCTARSDVRVSNPFILSDFPDSRAEIRDCTADL